MTRKPLHRAAAALLAGIFVLVGAADVYGFHRCPHHDPGSAPADDRPAAHSDRAAGAYGWVGSHDARDDAGEHRTEDGPCTCVGTCHGSATAPLAAAVPATDFVTPPLGFARTALSGTAAASGPVAYLLPYPTGPPLLS